MNKHVKIGELLVQNNLITQEQLDIALAKQKDTGEKLGQILIDTDILAEEKFLNFYSEQLKIPYIKLSDYKLDLEFSLQLPESQARLFHAILLSAENGQYLVGMIDPQDIFAIDEIKRILKHPLKLAIVAKKGLMRALDLIYRRTEEITSFAEELATELKVTELVESGGKETETAVSKLINSLFEDAVQIGASDIHIEPDEHVVRIRMRVDGQLQEQIIEGKEIAAALSQRLKLMAGLNIAEKRLPQDGRFNLNVRNAPVDVRLSTMPIQYGESIVMRLLNQATGILELDTLGMSKEMLQHLRKLIKLPKGIILVTGPTGSGKTTTLYAALNEMNVVTKKFITIEDPVEYRLPRINQIQVNPQLDLTFARVLRSTLRQDPDIILVGEIRDYETAEIAMRAALTGHLVLATLHTNDAASSAIRLIDMGVPGYLVAATVRAAMAQRLVRRICKSCIEDYQPTSQEASFFTQFFPDSYSKHTFKHGRGCEHCNHTGYQGRAGVFELIEFNRDMQEALRTNNPNQFVNLIEKDQLERSLLASAFELACTGVTTLSEALRIAGEQE